MRAELLATVDKLERGGEKSPWEWGELVYYNGRTGRLVEARSALKKIEELSKKQPIDPLVFTFSYIGLNEKELALQYTEKAYVQHSIALALIKVDPAYDSLRSESRFQTLLERMPLE